MSTKDKKEKQVENGNMINNLEELKEHSKVMENMSTNTNVKKVDKHPDPKQFNEKDK